MSVDPSPRTSFHQQERLSEPRKHETEPSPRSSFQHPEKLTDPEKDERPESTTPTLHSDSSQKGDEAVEENKPPPVNPWADPSSFPDGGTKAWLTVAGGACCLFVSFGWINCVGVFQDYYQRHQLHAYTPSEIAWIPSLQVFFMLACGPIVGLLYDNYGPVYLLVAGAFLHVFGLMMVSISKNYIEILLSQAVCSAIGASCVFYPAVSSVSTWFFVKRGQALGLVAAGSSLGGVLFPIMVSHLVNEVGFGWTMRICAFLILALLIFAIMTVRSRIPPTRRKFEFMAFVRPLTETKFVLLAAAMFFFYWGMFVPFNYLVVEAISHGMSNRLALYLVSIMNAASIFGRTVPNIVADKKAGRFNVMIAMSLLTTILILGMWIPAKSNAALIVFAIFFGVASGAGIGLTPALCAQISPIREIGVRQGTLFFIGSWAALTGSPIGGAILGDVHGDFKYAAVFAGCSTFIGFCLFVVTRVHLAGFKWAKI